MVYIGQGERNPGNFSRLKGFRMFEAISVLSPEDITANQHLVTTNLDFAHV